MEALQQTDRLYRPPRLSCRKGEGEGKGSPGPVHHKPVSGLVLDMHGKLIGVHVILIKLAVL